MFVLSMLLLSSAPALADCPSVLHPDGRVSEAEAEARADRITTALAADAADAELWTGAWLLTYTAITAGQLGALVALDDPGERTDLYVGIAGSFGALAGIPLFPLAVLEDGRLLAAYGRLERASVCRQLAIAERTLERDAENEAMGIAWFVHVANVAVNVALGLLLGLGYDRWLSAAISAASGTAIGELMLFTQPTGAIDALDEMRRR